MDYATVQDLVARWRALNAEETTLATTALSDASVQLRRDVPDLSARILAATDTDLVETAKQVVCAMVRRAMDVPDGGFGATAKQETQGPFSRSLSYSNPMGDLYTTKAERRRLAGGGVQQAFMIDLGPDTIPAPWWESLT